MKCQATHQLSSLSVHTDLSQEKEIPKPFIHSLDCIMQISNSGLELENVNLIDR